jgi:hypothetical protein
LENSTTLKERNARRAMPLKVTAPSAPSAPQHGGHRPTDLYVLPCHQFHKCAFTSMWQGYKFNVSARHSVSNMNQAFSSGWNASYRLQSRLRLWLIRGTFIVLTLSLAFFCYSFEAMTSFQLTSNILSSSVWPPRPLQVGKETVTNQSHRTLWPLSQYHLGAGYALKVLQADNETVTNGLSPVLAANFTVAYRP